MTEKKILIRRALISVSDKTYLVDFAKFLYQHDIEIISTGGSARVLKQHGIPSTDVAEFTGFPEMMGGRLKTLHPKIHGGILGRRGEDDAAMAQHQLAPIDLVVVNLYPFSSTVASPECTLDNAIEHIDVGGPTMVRAAAKNYNDVVVVVEPTDYSRIIEELRTQRNHIGYNTRMELAAKAFSLTAKYDAHIAAYMEQQLIPDTPSETTALIEFPEALSLRFTKKYDLRYGENPHQRAAFYSDSEKKAGTFAQAVQIQGPQLSFNNIVDADAASSCAHSFKHTTACVIVKHSNPCGVALADTPSEAYQLAFRSDPTSAFGGIIAFNQDVDDHTARAIIKNQFVEVIVAPGFSHAALTLFAAKPKVRLIVSALADAARASHFEIKGVSGGILVQEPDIIDLELANLQVVTQKAPTETQLHDLMFAWNVAKHVKSNAIVYAHHQSTLGVGAGQMSRVDSVRIGAEKAAQAQLSLKESVMASDAFFPFADSIELAGTFGISAIIQPGGSIRDAEVIAKADELNIAMVFTHIRHFRH